MSKRSKAERLRKVLPQSPAEPDSGFDIDLQDVVRRGVIQSGVRGSSAAKATLETFDRQAAEREHALLEGALIEEMREMSRLSFWYFLTNVLYPDTWQDHYHDVFHYDICQELQSLETGEDFWAFLPREFKKSFIIDIAHTVWLITCDPNIRILTIGAREATIKPFALLIRDMFVEGAAGMETFHKVFPDFVISRGDKRLRQALQFTHPLRTLPLPDPTFRAAYLGVSGAGWRCDVIKFDDPIERRNVSTPEQSQKSLRNMLDLLPLVHTASKYGNTIGMLTRWAYHDPGGHIIGDTGQPEKDEILAKIRNKKRRVMIRHALEHPTRRCTTCPEFVLAAYPHNDFDIEEGHPPDDPVHTRKMILDRYEEYKLDANLGESLFWHQYGNICLAPKDQKFQPEWFITAPFPYFNVCKRRAICVDSADKDMQEEGRGDWMVANFGEFDDFGRLLLVHCIASNEWTRATFVNAIVSWCQKAQWWPNVFGKEKYGNDTFLTDVQNKFNEYQHPVHVVTVPRPQSGSNIMKKQDWIIATAQAPMENGEVIFGSAYPEAYRSQTQHELTQLGQLARDDFADTLALMLSPEIRPSHLFARHVARRDRYAPPPLSLYHGPGNARIVEAPNADPLSTALQSKAVEAAFTALPDVNVKQLDPPEGLEGLISKYDF